MSYEPDWNEPSFYVDEGEQEVKCFKCSDTLDPDDIVWADVEGLWQVRGREGNDTAWCVVCLPSEEESK